MRLLRATSTPIRKNQIDNALNRSGFRIRYTLSSVVLTLALSGCGYEPFYLDFDSEFDPSLVNDVEIILRDTAAGWKLPVLETNRGTMEFFAKTDAIEIFLFRDSNARENGKNVVWMFTNEAKIYMMFLGPANSRMAAPETDLLAYELKAKLERKLGLQFCLNRPITGGCDNEAPERLAVWESCVQERISELTRVERASQMLSSNEYFSLRDALRTEYSKGCILQADA